MRHIYLSLLVVLLAVCVAPSVRAEGVAEERRYDSFMMDGALHRFDRHTGQLQKLQKFQGGALQWVPVEVSVSGAAPVAAEPRHLPEARRAPDAGRDPRLPAPPHPVQDNADLGQPRERRAPTIEVEDDQGTVFTDTVSADDRKAALPLVATYESKISLSHTVQIGDKITGNILIKNMGDRRIKKLELTMLVPIVGREKPEEHHFLFLDKPGHTTPPQPGSGGREPAALLQKVDIPCPSGGVKGSPELKITFIRFE